MLKVYQQFKKTIPKMNKNQCQYSKNVLKPCVISISAGCVLTRDWCASGIAIYTFCSDCVPSGFGPMFNASFDAELTWCCKSARGRVFCMLSDAFHRWCTFYVRFGPSKCSAMSCQNVFRAPAPGLGVSIPGYYLENGQSCKIHGRICFKFVRPWQLPFYWYCPFACKFGRQHIGFCAVSFW